MTTPPVSRQKSPSSDQAVLMLWARKQKKTKKITKTTRRTTADVAEQMQILDCDKKICAVTEPILQNLYQQINLWHSSNESVKREMGEEAEEGLQRDSLSLFFNVRKVRILSKWSSVVVVSTVTHHAASFSTPQWALAPRSRRTAPAFLQIHFLSLGTSLVLLAR